MRSGVLDIGSNCAQFLVVDATPGAPPLPLHAVKEPVLLGDDLDAEGRISAAGTERVATAVRRTLCAAGRFEVDHFCAFVTAAIRDAPNREDVLDRVEAVAGIRPQFLTGVQEARLTYLAVRHWYGWRAGTLLMLDIGGGSMEVVLGRDLEPVFAASLPLGAGRLTREFLTDDPPTAGERRELRRHVRDCLAQVRDRLHWEDRPRRVIGSSKTFKQLARLGGAPPQRKGPFVSRTLTRTDVAAEVELLGGLRATERARLRGVSVPRARQILAGAIVAETTMTQLGIRSLEVSPWALREGVVLHFLSSETSDRGDPTLRRFELHGVDPAPLSLLHGRSMDRTEATASPAV
ncbi:Ppx/GppA phosphatase family protein [Nocardia fluminea]|jgi:exopolyphosphatase/guanosine-5'-triphosphate,3'-diphosphate pyrophosphatase|uniref:Ppx/GppA phosphatase family protein n=1 Tax=Nocardia fluminea TaxID=134984 RepID=UPI0033D1495C